MFSKLTDNLLRGFVFKGFFALQAVFISCLVLVAGATVYASSTSTFNQTINAGTLAIDIVNGSYTTVGSPAITMNAYNFSFSCQSATGTFGTASEQIYVSNPDAADGGWSASLAASATTDL